MLQITELSFSDTERAAVASLSHMVHRSLRATLEGTELERKIRAKVPTESHVGRNRDMGKKEQGQSSHCVLRDAQRNQQPGRHGWVERIQNWKLDLEPSSLPFTRTVILLLSTLFSNSEILMSPILMMVLFQLPRFVLKIKLGNRFKDVDRCHPQLCFFPQSVQELLRTGLD